MHVSIFHLDSEQFVPLPLLHGPDRDYFFERLDCSRKRKAELSVLLEIVQTVSPDDNKEGISILAIDGEPLRMRCPPELLPECWDSSRQLSDNTFAFLWSSNTLLRIQDKP